MNIVWKIEKLNSRESDGYVTSANVKVYVDDGIGNNFIELACSWPNGEMSTPYDQLTETQVMNWVFASCDKESVEESFILQPTKPEAVVSGLPW
jgi:hypothetical protein